MNITGDFEKAAKSLLRTGKEHVRVEMTRKMDSGRLAVRTIRNLPGTLDTDETDILFFQDMSGAPTVEIAENIPCRTTSGREALNGNTSKRIFISLSDEADIRVCLAVSSKEDSSLLGVGIDLADVRDAAGILKVSPVRFRRNFSEKEWEHLAGKDEDWKMQYAARLLSLREAAFKSMSRVYNLYRKENQDRQLPVSFMDFCFPDGEGAVFRGMTADICKKEQLEIQTAYISWGSLAGSVAVCRKKKRKE